MDKKLTDSEIVKALEWCSNRYDCYSCEYYNQYCKGDMNVTLKDALDLINRLQEENERLQQYHDDMESAIYSFREDHAKVKFFKNEIKSEAYKEFAERLKENSIATFSFKGVVMVEEIDDLLKEMVGEDNDK